MIKFNNLVVEALHDYETSHFYELNEAAVVNAKGLSALKTMYEDNTYRPPGENHIENLKNKLKSFGINTQDNRYTVEKMYTYVQNVSRPNPGLVVNLDLHEVFPLFDFFCLVGCKNKPQISTEGFDDANGADENTILDCAKRVLDSLNTPGVNNLVFDYIPNSTPLLRDRSAILKKVAARNGVARIVLENFGTKSIKDTLYNLLELRNQARKTKLSTSNKVPKPKIDVEGFLYDIYNKSLEKSDPNLRLYDHVSIELLFEVSSACFDLFVAEYVRNIATITDSDFTSNDSDAEKQKNNEMIQKLSKDGRKVLKEEDYKQLYKKFIENQLNATAEFEWPTHAKGGSHVIKAQNNSLDDALKGGYNLNNIKDLNT